MRTHLDTEKSELVAQIAGGPTDVAVDDQYVYFTARSGRDGPGSYEDGGVFRRRVSLTDPVEVVAERQCDPTEPVSSEGAVYWVQTYPIIQGPRTFIGRISRSSR